MGVWQRRKGSGGERELARMLTDHLGTAVRRELAQTRDGSAEPDLRIGKFALEVKRRARIAGVYDWMQQAAEADGTPVVAMRADGQRWLMIMRLEDWIALAREEISADRSAQ